jgi:hypothetical protein
MGIKFDDSVFVVLATAPAGLGHIRVMAALKQGLSAKTRVAVMGVSDPSLQWIHRITSLNKNLKRVMEFTQENRTVERIFSHNYRKWLMNHPEDAEKALLDLVSNAWPQPETIVVLATHFGLAHQLAAVKTELARKLGVKLILAVVVTDDSPQQMWAVSGADVVFVPSNTTREKILEHMLTISPVIPEVVTIPYPISVTLGEPLSEEQFEERLSQMSRKKLRLMIPVSGAAVQLDYYKELIGAVVADGVEITVVSRDSSYTQSFLSWCRNMDNVNVVAFKDDGEVVEAYEREYESSVVGIEVTKPSEQAFKALYTPRQCGGSLLLFSAPVGRQEKDNLIYLRRHRLMPSVDDQARLNEWILRGNRLHITKELLARASHWRGVMLPESGLWSGIAIKRLKEAGIFTSMANFEGFLEGHEEINCDGVGEIWKYLQKFL